MNQWKIKLKPGFWSRLLEQQLCSVEACERVWFRALHVSMEPRGGQLAALASGPFTWAVSKPLRPALTAVRSSLAVEAN